jgi:hypothetical protein
VEFSDDIISCVVALDEPLLYQDATCDPSWVIAMEQEMASIHDRQTWSIVDFPPSHKPILMKWVYKLKSDIRFILLFMVINKMLDWRHLH